MRRSSGWDIMKSRTPTKHFMLTSPMQSSHRLIVFCHLYFVSVGLIFSLSIRGSFPSASFVLILHHLHRSRPVAVPAMMRCLRAQSVDLLGDMVGL